MEHALHAEKAGYKTSVREHLDPSSQPRPVYWWDPKREIHRKKIRLLSEAGHTICHLMMYLNPPTTILGIEPETNAHLFHIQ